MELPIRCFSCNTVLGNKWGRISDMKATGKTLPEIWAYFGFRRECCKFVVQTAISTLNEDQYEYTNGETVDVCDIGTDTIDTRRRQNCVVTVHRAV